MSYPTQYADLEAGGADGPYKDDDVAGDGAMPYGHPNMAAAPKQAMGHINLEEAGNSSYIATANKLVRQGFIRKVYSILSVQLVFTFGLTLLFTFNSGIQSFVMANVWMVYTAFAGSFVCLIAMACCQSAARTYPTNYMLLGMFTLLEGFLVAVTASFYESQSVVAAVGMTVVIFLGLTLYACQTKRDFTTNGGILFSLLMSLILLGFLNIFWRSHFLETLYSAAGALIFSAYIVFDTQRLMEGKRVKLSVDDYVLAALNLYVDVMNLFLYILSLLGKRR